ncbi:cyclic AMP-dependent transcription factor ATF-2 [Eurosta solidaginis]|uniref:cyclic AMP-dependent transcription factor ATF-2 n=1 Tax=Eurosta solidaginis TaxID=178769 RepID=UPI0035309776
MELSTEKVFDCGGDCEIKKKHEMMLDLSLSNQKSENLFAGSDQTPTPTRLIRNCEEVGLFEDLRHVNPFDETFRRACEQNNRQTPIRQLDSVEAHVDENSLHTPQVYPQLDATIQSCEMLSKPLDSPSSQTVTLDVPVVDDLLNAATNAYKIGTSRQNSNNSTTSSTGGYGKIYKYRTIAEKPVNGVACIQLPTTNAIQLIQPQLITLTFPDNNGNKNLGTNLETAKPSGALASNAIPVQTVKPFIMPKLAPATEQTKATTSAENRTMSTEVRTSTTTKQLNKNLPPLSTKPTSSTNTSTDNAKTTATMLTIPQQHEPSSASLTPTSQLPIKERLKAILSQGNRTHSAATTPLPTTKISHGRRKRNAAPGAVKYDEDSMVRRRAAATRYRNKMRNEHKELRRRNSELQAENEKLRARIKQLEKDLVTKSQQQMPQFVSGNLQGMPAQVQIPQIQIPPSTLRLVMNIPTMVVPARGQPSLIQPITYRVEKK